MLFRLGATLGAFVLSVAAIALATGALARAVGTGPRTITWADAAPLHARLERHGLNSASFAARIEEMRRANAQRVREGDLDHLVFYLLQSTRFTSLPAIEPAISAKRFVDSGRVPDAVTSRAAALVRALDSSSSDPRLEYFRQLIQSTFSTRRERRAGLLREYARVMRFLHEKEFVAQRSERPADAVAELYRARGLSTDTAVEAGYLVYQGLGVVKSLDPERRIRRVLIVGPGLDLAPRTALIEAGPPESYQPWAVIDALLALGLSQSGDLEVVGADINPRVVEHLRRSRQQPPTLTLVGQIQDSETVTVTDEYRRYFNEWGRAVGEVEGVGGAGAARATLQKTVRVRLETARALRAERLDVVTERLEGSSFDLVVATNLLPYFGDAELMLAISNIAAMLAPGGVFLHNEARPLLREVTADSGLPFEQSRHAIIATVRGVSTPLFDNVYLHRRN